MYFQNSLPVCLWAISHVLHEYIFTKRIKKFKDREHPRCSYHSPNQLTVPPSKFGLFFFLLLLIYLSMKFCLNMCTHIYICTSICIYIHTFIHTHVTQICYLKDMNTIMLCLCLVTCFLHTSNVLELFPHTGLSHSL